MEDLVLKGEGREEKERMTDREGKGIPPQSQGE